MSIKYIKGKNFNINKILKYIPEKDQEELNISYDNNFILEEFTPKYWLYIWYNRIESSKKKIYLYLKKNILKGFVLLSLTDEIDEWGYHNKPYFIDFIFVFKKYRRRGIATKLIKQLIKNHQINTVCDTEEILSVFMKTGDFFLRNPNIGTVQSKNDYLNERFKPITKEINLSDVPPDEDVIF
jgi:GNAT superfamily N-acetyltransferase